MQLLSVFEDFNFWIGMGAHAQSIPIVFRQQNNKKMTIMYKTNNAYRMKTATCIPNNTLQFDTTYNPQHVLFKNKGVQKVLTTNIFYIMKLLKTIILQYT